MILNDLKLALIIHVQGNASYDPNSLTVRKGDTIQVINRYYPHTVTSGKTLEDPNKGKRFDTSMINAGATAKISTANLNPGQYPFHCDVHPYDRNFDNKVRYNTLGTT